MNVSVDVSIVSHGHGAMVDRLVADIRKFPEVARIIVTRNISESSQLPADTKTIIIENTRKKGFGANHNAAFAESKAPYFCVLNPDIEFQVNPFPALIAAIQRSNVSVIAPMVVNNTGNQEDSVRHFPTIRHLVGKLLGLHDGRYVLQPTQGLMTVEWVAGMFIIFRSDDFKLVGGFDEKFFLYYEDVDICARIWSKVGAVSVYPQIQVVHNAQRASHREMSHMMWHAASMLRFFGKHWGRLPRNTSLGRVDEFDQA